MNLQRKLLVLGVNRALEDRVLHLDPDVEVGGGHLFAEIAGAPGVFIWRTITAEEMEISVWWNYEHSRHPQANPKGPGNERFNGPTPLAKPERYKEFVGAVACGWLARRTGAFLQGYGGEGISHKYVRRADAARLAALSDPVPAGFKAEGQFFS